jgi:hypothetical protein
METVQTPAENTTSTPQKKVYNPLLNTQVTEKPYSQMVVDTDPTKLQTAIPQPAANPNRISGNENAYGMLNQDMGSQSGGSPSSGGGGGNAGSKSAFNPAMNEMGSAEKKVGAEQLAKIIVDSYEQLKLLSNRLLQISPKKIRKLQAEGELDLSVQIPYDYGTTISAGELIETLNEQNKDVITVSKEFRKEVLPPLTRILEKRGAGLTDEQVVLFAFAKDAGVTGFQIYQGTTAINQLIETMKERTAAAKEGGYVTPPPTATAQNKASTPNYGDDQDQRASTPVPRMPITTDQENFNFATNDTYAETMVQRHEIPDDGKAALMRRKKIDREIEAAVKKNAPVSNTTASQKLGKRGRKPKDYIPKMDEDEIAESLILRETKETDLDVIKGLDI